MSSFTLRVNDPPVQASNNRTLYPVRHVGGGKTLEDAQANCAKAFARDPAITEIVITDDSGAPVKVARRAKAAD